MWHDQIIIRGQGSLLGACLADVIDLFIFSCLAWLHFNKYDHKDIIGRNSFTQKRKRKCESVGH